MRRLSAYRVFLTHQSEYHIRGHVCFGVRSRRTGDWFAQHWALSRPLATAYADDHGRLRGLRLPAIGEPLCFQVEGELLETTPVLGVESREHFELAPLAACGPALPERARKVRDAS
jgi:hypothetical protein